MAIFDVLKVEEEKLSITSKVYVEVVFIKVFVIHVGKAGDIEYVTVTLYPLQGASIVTVYGN